MELAKNKIPPLTKLQRYIIAYFNDRTFPRNFPRIVVAKVKSTIFQTLHIIHTFFCDFSNLCTFIFFLLIFPFLFSLSKINTFRIQILMEAKRGSFHLNPFTVRLNPSTTLTTSAKQTLPWTILANPRRGGVDGNLPEASRDLTKTFRVQIYPLSVVNVASAEKQLPSSEKFNIIVMMCKLL